MAANPRFRQAAVGGWELSGEGEVVALIGIDPLWQPLIAAPGGRLQALDEAWDPARKEWFSVSASPAEPGEWGHWTGRGANWNSMCAACHNTGVSKGYSAETDAYATTMWERGVGCEACHGPGSLHAADPSHAVPLSKPGLDTCAPCHSRRATLAESTDPATPMMDLGRPLLLPEGDYYWPDGQVWDEVFELGSFLSSRMHQLGVGCGDCHDAHGGQLKLEGDALCLRCHAAQPAFTPHDHHPEGSAGAACVGCHMPLTTYMGRHPRRDHGFTVPDPALTVDAGIPNACTRCHEAEGPAWAAEWWTRWYGEGIRPRQARSRALAGAATPNGLEALIEVAAGDPNPFWRAIGLGMLRPWAAEPRARQLLLSALSNEEALIRLEAAGALSGGAGEAAVAAALAGRLEDPVRAVRLEAIRALRSSLAPGSPALVDYEAWLALGADQPQGAFELATFRLEAGQPEAAIPLLERVVRWDPADRQASLALATSLEQAGRVAEALRALKTTLIRFPDYPEGWYTLGMMAWRQGEGESALRALQKAESTDPSWSEPPLTAALILQALGRPEEARAAARRAAALGDPRAAALLAQPGAG